MGHNPHMLPGYLLLWATCNAPDSMRHVFASYSPPLHVICLCVAFYHVIMCISFCIRVRLMHPSIFPVVRFAIRRSYLLRCTPLVFFCVRVSNFLGMDRGLSSGLNIPPGVYQSSFVGYFQQPCDDGEVSAKILEGSSHDRPT